MSTRLPTLLLRFAALLSLIFFAGLIGWNWFAGTSTTWAVQGDKSGDLIQHYAAGQLWKEGRLTELYRNFYLGDWINQWSEDQGMARAIRIEKFNYVYGPSIAAVSAALADLSWPLWINLWASTIPLAYLAAFLLLWKMEPAIRRCGLPAILLYFGFPSFYYSFVPLQNSCLTLLILLSSSLLLQRNCGFSAGLVLSCAFYKPQLMPYLGLFALLCRQWRFAFGIGFGSAAWLVLAVLTCGLEAHLLWLESLRDMAGGLQFQRNAMSISLRAFFLTALPADFRPWIDRLSPLLSFALLFLVAWKTRQLSLRIDWWQPQHSFYAGLVAWTLVIPYCGHYEVLLGLPWWLLYLSQPGLKAWSIFLSLGYWLISAASISGTDLPVSITSLFTLPWLLATLWTLPGSQPLREGSPPPRD